MACWPNRGRNLIDLINWLNMNAAIKSESTMREELLPFVIRPAVTEQDYFKAVDIRHRAYARHVPEFAASLRVAETADYEDGSLVLLAEAKLDGSPLGTMRIQSNVNQALHLEESITLPSWLQGASMLEASRLAVELGAAGRLVRVALFKACYFYCVEAPIDWMVITAREPLDRLYESLLFQDVLPGGGMVPIHHVGNIPHRVMALSVLDGYSAWAEANHPLFRFFFQTIHPDIRLSEIRNTRSIHRRAPEQLGHVLDDGGLSSAVASSPGEAIGTRYRTDRH